MIGMLLNKAESLTVMRSCVEFPSLPESIALKIAFSVDVSNLGFSILSSFKRASNPLSFSNHNRSSSQDNSSIFSSIRPYQTGL